MAKDIYMEFDTVSLDGDLVIENGDLKREEGLSTAVMISLFTDARADDSDPYDNNDRKGWWGDLVSEVDGDNIGSKLYLLDRSKITDETTVNAKQYIIDALQWMIEDEVAESVEVDTWIFGSKGNERLGTKIQIFKKEGNDEVFTFDDLWSNTPTVGV